MNGIQSQHQSLIEVLEFINYMFPSDMFHSGFNSRFNSRFNPRLNPRFNSRFNPRLNPEPQNHNISAYIVETYNDSIGCSVCCENYCVSEEIWKLPCGHIFHSTCILNWFEKDKHTCPSCRYDSRSTKIEVVCEIEDFLQKIKK